MKNLTLVIPAKNEEECLPKVLTELNNFLHEMPKRLEELENLVVGNEILLIRTREVAKHDQDYSINNSVSGPVLRST